jgi:hypothetical protein
MVFFFNKFTTFKQELDRKAGSGPEQITRILSEGKKILTHLADGERRRPLRSENVQANRAVRADVRMINAGSERILSD